MSAGAILCVVFLVVWLATHDEPARRRRHRREFSHAETVARAKRQMSIELRPAYPPPPAMPAEDIQ